MSEKHKWKSHKNPDTPDGPGEWITYCDNCGAEMDEDNEDDECVEEEEEMSQQPTPGPWGMYGPAKGRLTFDYEMSVGPTGDYLGPIAIVGGDNDEHAKANAELIVAACNAAQQANPANPLAAARALPELVAVLQGILDEPYGCPMCDSGKLRNQAKDHWPDCPYFVARAAIAAATKGKEQ